MIGYLFLSIPVGAWLVAALNDAEEMKIPNWISIALLVTFPAAALYFQFTTEMFLGSVALGIAVLIGCFILFALNVFGGGDAKLLAASAPWVGVAGFLPFIIKITLMGGALAILVMMFRRMPPLPIYAHVPWLMQAHEGKSYIPYGIAIAAGGVWSLPDLPIYVLVTGG